MKGLDFIKYLFFPITAVIVITWFAIYFVYRQIIIIIPKALTKIKKQMSKLFIIILNWIRLLRIRYQMRPSRLKKAIRKADRLHAVTGKRYRVFFFGDRYRVWDRQDIRRQQSDRLLRKDKKAGADFDQICFYDTNKKGGKDGLSNS